MDDDEIWGEARLGSQPVDPRSAQRNAMQGKAISMQTLTHIIS